MSFSHFQHPLDVTQHPSLEPEVKRAILARWASDAAAVADNPGLRKPSPTHRPVLVDDIFDALRALDRPDGGAHV